MCNYRINTPEETANATDDIVSTSSVQPVTPAVTQRRPISIQGELHGSGERNLVDLQSGLVYANLEQFVAETPEGLQVNFFEYLEHNEDLVLTLIMTGYEKFEDIPRGQSQFDYFENRNNDSCRKWRRLMQKIGFDDVEREFTQLESKYREKVDCKNILHVIAAIDFITNEYLNSIGINPFWYMKGSRM